MSRMNGGSTLRDDAERLQRDRLDAQAELHGDHAIRSASRAEVVSTA
jgi:hypothetical protein